MHYMDKSSRSHGERTFRDGINYAWSTSSAEIGTGDFPGRIAFCRFSTSGAIVGVKTPKYLHLPRIYQYLDEFT